MNKLHSGCGIHLGAVGIDRDIAIKNRILRMGIAAAVYGIPSIIAFQVMTCAIGFVPTTALAILAATIVGYGIYRIAKAVGNSQPSHP